jgi:hypothetical protein
MAIAVTCSHCGVKLRFKSELAGTTTKCRSCAQDIVVKGETVADHDVFISYSSKDKPVADAITSALENRRVRCWIAPRDILPGKPWAGAILDAIADARAMVLVYSANSNGSPQVIREVDRAVHHGITVVPFRIQAAEMSKEMEYYISAAHWLDATGGAMDGHVTLLAEKVQRLLAEGGGPQPVEPISAAPASAVNETAAPARSTSVSVGGKSKPPMGLIIGGAAAVVALIAIIAIAIAHKSGSGPSGQNAGGNAASTSGNGGGPTVSSVVAPGPTPPAAASSAVDLLSKINLPDDGLSGQWTKSSQGLLSDDFKTARVRVNVQPAGEYDMQAVFTRLAGDGDVILILPCFGHAVAWHIGAARNQYSGLQFVDNQPFTNNATSLKRATILINGTPATARAEVRKDHISLYLDGSLAGLLRTDYTNVRLTGPLNVGRGLFGIATNSPTLISKVELTPIGDQTPAPPPVPPVALPGVQPVDVMGMAKVPGADILQGKWKRPDTGGVQCLPGDEDRLRLPYQPPGEYDLRAIVVPLGVNPDLTLVLGYGTKNFTFDLHEGGDNGQAVFGLFAGRPRGFNRPAAMGVGVPSTIIIQVRKDSMSAFVDDSPVGPPVKTDYSNVSLYRPKIWDLPPGALGLDMRTSFLIKSVEVFPLPGPPATAPSP